MKYEWDDVKCQANLEKHRIGFTAIEDFEWGTAKIKSTSRREETRYIASGYIRDRLHTVIYAERGDFIRIISLRKASRQEEREYAQA